LSWQINELIRPQLQIISKTRTGRTQFTYTCQILVENRYAEALDSIIYTLVYVPANVTAVDTEAIIGFVDAGCTAISFDTIQITVDRSIAIESNQMVWDVRYWIATDSGVTPLFTGLPLFMNLTDPADYTEIISFTRTESGCNLIWRAGQEYIYYPLYSHDLMTWDLADTGLLVGAGADTISWFDSGSLSNCTAVDKCFYRIKVAPYLQ
jgi:hypothetical protein